MFVPLIASAKPADEATEEALKVAGKSEQKEVKQGGAKTRPEVQIPMASIVGMRKSNKTAMGCVVSTGLQIDVDDGSVSGQCSVRPEKKRIQFADFCSRVSSSLSSPTGTLYSTVCWPYRKELSDGSDTRNPKS